MGERAKQSRSEGEIYSVTMDGSGIWVELTVFGV